MIRKVDRHYSSVFCQSETELNRFTGGPEETMEAARKLAKEHTTKHKTTPEARVTCIITTYNHRLAEWVNPVVYENGYEE